MGTVVTDKDALREIYKRPNGRAVAKELRSLDPHCRRFVELSPFVVMGTSGANGQGVSPRGGYCRDLLEASRLIDLYTLLGVPLHVTLGYPAAAGADADADPDLRVGAGRWREGFSPKMQAEWASEFGSLVLAKGVVQSVHWAHLSDAQPHQFPHCGLYDSRNQPRPVLDSLRALREQHLR